MITTNGYNVSYSVTLNRNFRIKVGRQLVGYSGAGLLLGFDYLNHIIDKAMRSKSQIFRYKAQKLDILVLLYSK